MTYLKDQLEYQLARASDLGLASSDVDLLPSNPSVLLMDADGIGHDDWVSCRRARESVDVVDDAEAVAAELEVVGVLSSAALAKVVGTLAVDGRARVTVRNGHLRGRQTIKDGAAFVHDVAKDLRESAEGQLGSGSDQP